MRVTKLLPMIPLVIVMVIGDTKHDISEEENNISESVGTARIFPLLPPYQGVDFAANFNKLKSAGDAAYFVVRDGITFLGVNLMWILIHSLIWDGEVSNLQDITASILSPGQKVALSNTSPTSASSRLTLNSLSELNPTKMWNFFANPNTSTRNLFLNIGFALGGHILWILPTFLGTLPENSRSEERVGGLPANLASADPATLWNRLFCPQCVLQLVGINSINYFGKILFWTFMSSISDLPASTVIGRAFDNRDEVSLVNRVFNGMVDNVREIMDTGKWWNEISDFRK